MSKVGLPTAGTVQLVKATPIERVAAFTRVPRLTSAERFSPCSAAAPTIFSTIMVPATPRRPMLCVDFSTATSSSVKMVCALGHISAASEKFITSPA